MVSIDLGAAVFGILMFVMLFAMKPLAAWMDERERMASHSDRRP